jgi:hypothetical protein
MNRRSFLAAAIAAPAIVRSEILMPVVKVWTPVSIDETSGWVVLVDGNRYVSGLGIEPYRRAYAASLERMNARR